MKAFFVTGTDTGVGKTLVACALLHAFRSRGFSAVGMKPVAVGRADPLPAQPAVCGQRALARPPAPDGCANAVSAGREDGRAEDVEALIASSSVSAPRQWVSPFALTEPIAPHIAAKREGVRIDLDVIATAFLKLKNLADVVVVEGVGGFVVPLNERETTADLAQRLELPVLLVVGLRLGCLNHALLTAEAVRSRGLPLAGWVGNQIVPGLPALNENVEALEHRLGAPCLGVVPFLGHPAPEAVAPLLRNL